MKFFPADYIEVGSYLLIHSIHNSCENSKYQSKQIFCALQTEIEIEN